MSEITDAGFVRTSPDDVKTALEASWRSIFGADIDLDPESPDGQLIGVLSESLGDLHQLAEDVYNGVTPAGASGAMLSRLMGINGLQRNAGDYSTVTLTLTGTSGVVIPEGSLIGHATQSDVVFTTTAAATLAWGTASVAARCTEKGAVAAEIGSLSVILTVVAGWTQVTNAAEASLGTPIETDPEARNRREVAVATPSQAMLDGLYGALLADVDENDIGAGAGCEGAAVYENDTSDTVEVTTYDTTELAMPPHSIWVITNGGDNADIAAVLWRRKSSGVTQYQGFDTSPQVEVTDSQGFTHTMLWDTAQEVAVAIAIELDTPSPVPAGVQTAIKAAIIEWSTTELRIGRNVSWARILGSFDEIDELADIDVNEILISWKGLTSPATANLETHMCVLPTLVAGDITISGTV